MTKKKTVGKTAAKGVDFVPRSAEHVLNLPSKFRWEATRRHPYYLIFWKSAQRYRDGEFEGTTETIICNMAFRLLCLIGVTGKPVSPAIDYEDLGDEEERSLVGSVQPMTLRSAALMLLANLPQAELLTLSGVFSVASKAEYAEGERDQRQHAIECLEKIVSPAFDSYAKAPLFYVHLQSSQRTIMDDLKTQLGHFQHAQGKTSTRVHADKLPKYIEVWDLREGWTGEEYDLSQELSFKDIAEQLKEPLSTVHSQYLAAFELIVGRPFAPDLWWRVMGPLKFNMLSGDPEEVYSGAIRHRFQSPVPRPVPESRIWTPKEEQEMGPVERGSSIQGDSDVKLLFNDTLELIKKGLDNESIAQELGVSSKLVEGVRTRGAELTRLFSSSAK
ncbi:hypothetical protein Pan216_07900 [Planctomycetes bacterium Pan216]|uniref:Uncharacterized protein n=1 Tax=Kolteria novifilia TaxID=2527975 RepID=A0A518AYZ5_9BACT|nr:hypothetical protein Pan216_07900 [Planctomycetes bacterium Pan216]